MKKLTIIGCGNMGGAIARGLSKTSSDAKNWLSLCDISQERLEEFKKDFGLRVSTEIKSAIADSEIIIVALKPHLVLDALAEIKSNLKNKEKPLLISVAAGIRIEQMNSVLGAQVEYARVMPNLPCLIGEGISGYYANRLEDAAILEEIFSTVGEVVRVENEEDLNTVTGLSGSGPAFAFYVIEALALGGVEKGLKKDVALKLARKTVEGAAKMLALSDKSPEELIQQVATPGGTTMEGLAVLKSKEVAEAFSDTVVAATNRAIELGKQ